MKLGVKSRLEVLSAVRDPAILRNVLHTIRSFRDAPTAECNCCGYVGRFDGFGPTNRSNAKCPTCKSKERHRLIYLAHAKRQISFVGMDVLHFAPEPIIGKLVTGDHAKSYVTADIAPGRGDLVLNIEKIELADASYDVIICSHVLEHVDDVKALKELRRILRPGGVLLALVPIVEGWRQTYENPAARSPEDQIRHFAQADHVRFYGADFRDRIRGAGFALEEITGSGEEAAQYSLMRGETIFKAARA